jgi:hypothetical protein
MCEQCGKKFKVFAKRKKCLHCMIVVCKYCYAPHVDAKHPSAAVRFHAALASQQQQQQQRRSLNTSGGLRASLSSPYDPMDDDVDDEEHDVHFLSPVNKRKPKRMDYDDDADLMLLDNVDDIEIVSGDEDDDDDEEEEDMDEEDEEEDEDMDEAVYADDDGLDSTPRASMTEHDARMTQYAEFLQLQDAVATWTRREIAVKKQQRIAKRDSCYSMTAIPNVRSTREYQERELFVVSYSIVVTLLVWVVYACGYFAYVNARTAIVRSMTYVA